MSATTTEMGRRERKKLATRDALEAAALEHFDAHGFDGTTIEDITESVDVARRTFFRYFDSKEAVVFADADSSAERLRAVLAARPADESVLAGLRAALHALTDLQSGDHDRQLLRARIAIETPSVAAYGAALRDRWEAPIAEWVTDRLACPPTDLRPALIAGAMVSGLGTAMGRWVASPATEDPHVLVDEALDLLEAGFTHITTT